MLSIGPDHLNNVVSKFFILGDQIQGLTDARQMLLTPELHLPSDYI